MLFLLKNFALQKLVDWIQQFGYQVYQILQFIYANAQFVSSLALEDSHGGVGYD